MSNGYDPNYFTSNQNMKDNIYGGEGLYEGGDTSWMNPLTWFGGGDSNEVVTEDEVVNQTSVNEHSGNIVNGKNVTLNDFNIFNEDGSINTEGAIKNADSKINPIVNNNTFNSANASSTNVVLDKNKINELEIKAKQKKTVDDTGETDESGKFGDNWRKNRPFKSLFGKIRDRVGSYSEDEDEFIEDGDGGWIKNPNVGQVTNKGEGLFTGKEGGFMSKFGTGHGLLSGALKGAGKGIGVGLSNAGKGLMSGGGYQYGDFYDKGDKE